MMLIFKAPLALLIALVVQPALAESVLRQVIADKDKAPLIYLEAGEFPIGSSESGTRALVQKLKLPFADVMKYDLTQQRVKLPALYIDKFEVTNKRYDLFVKETGAKPSRLRQFPQFNDLEQPVTGMTWADAAAYCKWAGRRLPTEQEWERAARGSDGRTWPWGEAAEAKRFNGKIQGQYAAVRVGHFPSGDTPEGVSDMAGNVWELTASDWGEGFHTMKGGSFLNVLSYVRSGLRWATANETKGAEYLGFRCIVDASTMRASK
jgi:formylglycine-generating enzyme required for sulfatase activity